MSWHPGGGHSSLGDINFKCHLLHDGLIVLVLSTSFIGANGPRFTGTVPILEALSPVPVNSIVCPHSSDCGNNNLGVAKEPALILEITAYSAGKPIKYCTLYLALAPPLTVIR